MRQENGSIRKLRELLDDKIAAVESVMREGLESASTDYCRFFEWKAAYLYKGELQRKHSINSPFHSKNVILLL